MLSFAAACEWDQGEQVFHDQQLARTKSHQMNGNVSITSVNIQRVYIQFGGCHEMRPIRRQENDGVSCSMIWEAETEHKPQTQITLYGSNHVHKYHFTRQLSFWSSSQSWASPPPRKVIFVRNKTSDTLDLNLPNISDLQLYLKNEIKNNQISHFHCSQT